MEEDMSYRAWLEAQTGGPPPVPCINDRDDVSFNTWDRTTNPVPYINLERQKFGIKKCLNPACKTAYENIRRVAPTCVLKDCPDLREWVLNFVSCCIACRNIWRNCMSWRYDKYGPPPPGSVNSGFEPSPAARFCHEFIKEQYRGAGSNSVHFVSTSTLGICELFYWAASIFYSAWEVDGRVLEHALGEQDVMSLVLREDILDIPKGVCRYRFWNIGMSTFRGAVELVSLKSFLQQVNLSDRHLERHANCTVQLCWQNDENTTEVSQLHICHPGTPCKTKEFATSKVNEIPNPEDGATAWSISSMTPKLGCERYMAISHVWSDGTGAGSNESGHVNMCLIERFSKIAKREDIKCDGIWWDTISLPTDKKKKVMALNKMHKNYQKASCTLVHDLELIEFPWAGDGSPCVALAFSTWFSRGWTALELYMSEKVWVLFGSPGDDSLAPNDRNNYVLKDLDRDILACPNDPFAHPAHKAVSGIIRKLRPMHQCLVCQGKACGIYPPGHGIPPQLHQILSFLRLRYTCWTRDRSIIAALIVGERYGATEWFDSTWPQTRITQEILTKCEELSPYTLLHNQVPICETGKWSWCPPSVFDLCDSQVLYYEPLKVKNGEIHGKWMTYQFKKELEGRLRPYTTHDIMKHRILSAFQNPEEYILLAPLDRVTTHNEASLILAKYKIDEVRYEFIGVVILSRAEIDVIREEKEGKEKGKTGSKKKKGKSSQDIVLT